jgi:hypothetical protein
MRPKGQQSRDVDSDPPPAAEDPERLDPTWEMLEQATSGIRLRGSVPPPAGQIAPPESDEQDDSADDRQAA